MKRAIYIPLVALCLLAGHSARGQIQVKLELDRTTWVQHEPITGTLTLVNRAGRDLIFGDSGGLSWLDFSISDKQGHLVTPVRNERNTTESPIVVSAGQTYEHPVTVNRRYPMAQIGVYRVNATVNFPQIKRVFRTKTENVQVTKAQPMWDQIVGVPEGHPQAGAYRKYSLMTFFYGSRSRALYFRLENADTGRVYKTYPIGSYMSVREPKYAVDRQNRLHVLHMSAPKRYDYTVIGIDGEPQRQVTYYAKGNNRPRMKTTDFGEVSIRGGLTEEEMSEPYEQTEFRRLSERPPGLPKF